MEMMEAMAAVAAVAEVAEVVAAIDVRAGGLHRLNLRFPHAVRLVRVRA